MVVMEDKQLTEAHPVTKEDLITTVVIIDLIIAEEEFKIIDHLDYYD